MPFKNKEIRLLHAKSYCKKWRNANSLATKKYRLKTLYGLAMAQYQKILASQEGKCAICGRYQDEFKKRLSVDHDHKTGRVRGLLCQSCNTVLGLMNDSIDRLTEAISYLKRSTLEG